MAAAPTWQLQKQAALQQRRPHGDVMVTSFTDQQPLHGWEPVHAVRELWQNFRDGLRDRFGRVQMTKTTAGFYEARALGADVVGSLDCTQPNVMVLTQQQAVLTAEHLQMASLKGNRQEAIGGHGEGFKVGINLLLRLNYQIEYVMPYCTWCFELRHHYSQQFKNMCVVTEWTGDRESLVIRIRGPKAESLFDPNIDMQLSPHVQVVACEGTYGSILTTTDARAYGRVYCRGLFVAVDDSIKALEIAINLNVQVARDRHLIPGDAWKLVARILDDVAETYKGNPRHSASQAAVFDHLISTCAKHTPRSTTMLIPVSHIREPIRRFVGIQNCLQPGKVVFLEHQESPVKALLTDLGYFVVGGTGCLADAVDVEQLRRQYIAKLPAFVVTDTTEKRCLQSLNELVNAIKLTAPNLLMFNFSPRLVVKDLPAQLAQRTPEVDTADMNIVVVARSDLTADELPVAGQGVLGCYQRLAVNAASGLKRALAVMMVNFSKAPFDFKAKRYDSVDDHAATTPTRAKRDQEQAGPSAATGAEAGTAGPATNAKRARHDADDGRHDHDVDDDGSAAMSTDDLAMLNGIRPTDALGVNDRTRRADFRGVAGNYPGQSAGGAEAAADVPKGKPANCMRVNDGDLTPHIVVGTDGLEYVVYFKPAILAKLLGDDDYQSRFAKCMPVVQQAIAILGPRICASLSMNEADLPIIFAAIDPMFAGFTRPSDGGVFVNIVVLINSSDLHAMGASLFKTILHELAHRAHASHDTYFADECMSLTYRCRNALD